MRAYLKVQETNESDDDKNRCMMIPDKSDEKTGTSIRREVIALLLPPIVV